MTEISTDNVPDMTTIVIPTRHRADYLATTLASIRVAVDEARRAGWGVRVLVVDDASEDDDTRLVAEQADVDYSRIEVHDGQSNPAAAIVLGVSLVTTRYLSLFGDDDIMLPRFVVAHLEKLEQGYDMCAGSFARTNKHLVVEREVVLRPPHLGDLLVGAVGINDGAMTLTELMQRGPWDSTQAQRVILPVWIKILTEGARCIALEEVTFLYRRHDSNISDRIESGDAQKRLELIEPFLAAYRERGERIPPSRQQLVADEDAARAEHEVRSLVPSQVPLPAAPDRSG